MPELPEVEIVRRGLERGVVGRTIAAVQVHHPRAVRRHLAGATDFAALLTGRTVTAALRRGKYPDKGTAAKVAKVLHGVAGQLETGA